MNLYTKRKQKSIFLLQNLLKRPIKLLKLIKIVKSH